jgi:DnaK suppressor protein
MILSIHADNSNSRQTIGGKGGGCPVTREEKARLKNELLRIKGVTLMKEYRSRKNFKEENEAFSKNDNIDTSVCNERVEMASMSVQVFNKELLQIDRALERIERLNPDDPYGVCQECGEEITFKRLMASPFADLCISCKEGDETSNLKDPHGVF